MKIIKHLGRIPGNGKNMLFPKKMFKHYGLFRSGTNYFEAIVQANYHVNLDLAQYGWKHGEIDKKPPCDTALIVKNPYAWLVSLYNYATKPKSKKYFAIPAEIDFSGFIRRKYFWKGDTGFGGGSITQTAINPIMFWNTMISHWLENVKYVFRYDELLIDPEESLSICSFKRKTDEFIYPSEDLSPGSAGRGNISYDIQRLYPKTDYYLKNEYLRSYASKDFAFMAITLQHDLMWKLKYPLL